VRPHIQSRILAMCCQESAIFLLDLTTVYVHFALDSCKQINLKSSVAMCLTGICSIGRNFFSGRFIRDEDGTFYDNATVYTNNAMLALECAPKCSTQTKRMGAITDDISYTIKISQLQDWVTDVRAIINAELEQPQARLNARYGDGKVQRCTSPGLIWLRFGQKSNNLVSMNTGAEDVVYAQWSTMQSVFTPNRPSKHAAIIETIEQLNLCKYKARPHWGKNYERAFRHHECHLRDNFPESNIAQLLELQKRHDPAKVFEPELFRHVMERSGPLYSNECSLTYGCYCMEDVHCAQGYVCRPSRPFPMYKICKRPEPVGRHSEL
jgi:L-gulonolactone oxidase